MASASDYVSRKQNVPSELRSKEWEHVQAQVRERALFMASVANAKELHKWRSVMEQVTSGAMSPGQAREEMRRYLEKIGYSPDPGLGGTIKDRSTVQRMKVSIDTNVAMARGWAARMEALDDVLSPGQELYRQRESRVKRNWAEKWQQAAEKVGWQGVARNGQMIALVTSPIWVELSRFDTPYPPFDYNSGMRVRPVDFEVCEELGLVSLDDMDALEAEMQAQKESLNADVKASIEGLGEDLIDAVQNQLKGLVRREHTKDGDVLVMTDPNGTKPYSPQEIGKIITAPLPNGIKNKQLIAYRDWVENSGNFDGERPAVGLDEKEDVARLFRRITCQESEETIYRALSWGSPQKMDDLERIIERDGFYTPKPGKVADSFSSSPSNTEYFAGKHNFQMVIVCTRHKTARDIRPLYDVTIPKKQKPYHGIKVEAELVILGGTRLKVYDKKEETWEGGKRITYYVEEI